MSRRPSTAVLVTSAVLCILLALSSPSALADSGMQSAAGATATGGPASPPPAAADGSSTTTLTTTPPAGSTITPTGTTTPTSPSADTSSPTTPPAATPPTTTITATPPSSTATTPAPATTAPTATPTPATNTVTQSCGGSAATGASCGGSTPSAGGLVSAGSAAGSVSAGSTAGPGSAVTVASPGGGQSSPVSAVSTGVQTVPPGSPKVNPSVSLSASSVGQNPEAGSSGSDESEPPPTAAASAGNVPSQPAMSHSAASIGIPATLVPRDHQSRGQRGAVRNAAAVRAKRASLIPIPQSLPGIAHANGFPNPTLAAFVDDAQLSSTASAAPPDVTVLPQAMPPSVVRSGKARVVHGTDSKHPDSSKPPAEPPQPNVATGTRGPRGPQGGSVSVAGGAGAPSTLMVMVAFALLTARLVTYVTRASVHLQCADAHRLERPG